MSKPILVIMAAGLGSRYGGLKQIAPVDDKGHILIDYALYDAKRAGFETVVFIITKALERDFRDIVGDRTAKHMEVRYAFQRNDALPPGFTLPPGRTKPWGTGHAVLSAKNQVDANFATINADDFYGAGAFRLIYDFLEKDASPVCHALVGYHIENTLTEHGHVARGVCQTAGNRLLSITERTHVEPHPGGAVYTDESGTTPIPAGTVVSMNMWGFHESVMPYIESGFAEYLSENLTENPLKCEYFIPLVPNRLLMEKKAEIRVLPTAEQWYGVTYADDMPRVRTAIDQMHTQEKYPEGLLE